jgi:hypothetical protein
LNFEPLAEATVLPTDLPRVAVTGVPTRLRFGETPAEQRAYWEWLWVELDGGGALAVFDPDHLCTPGWFGRQCRIGIEFFHPALAPNPEQHRALVPQASDADPTAPPQVAGRVIWLTLSDGRAELVAIEPIDGSSKLEVRSTK